MNHRELHFYPGSDLLVYVELNGGTKKTLDRAPARGGPPEIRPSPGMAARPTTAGSYIIEKTEAYTTPSWAPSQIRWGTPLKDMPALNDVFYQVRAGIWGSLRKDFGFSRSDIRDEYFRLYQRLEVPRAWIFNDFGPLAVRYFIDKNKNGRMDGNEVLMGEMVHTTPDIEAQWSRLKASRADATKPAVELEESHGCIHIRPGDRDRLMKLGAFKRGTPFIVHPYTEKYQ